MEYYIVEPLLHYFHVHAYKDPSLFFLLYSHKEYNVGNIISYYHHKALTNLHYVIYNTKHQNFSMQRSPHPFHYL